MNLVNIHTLNKIFYKDIFILEEFELSLHC